MNCSPRWLVSIHDIQQRGLIEAKFYLSLDKGFVDVSQLLPTSKHNHKTELKTVLW